MPRHTRFEYRIKKLFSDKEFVGNVLQWSTRLEFWLECVLVQYFCRADRQRLSLEELLPEVTFSRKIELLSRLRIRKRVSSHRAAVRGLRRFRRVRTWSPTIGFCLYLRSRTSYRMLKSECCSRITQRAPTQTLGEQPDPWGI